MAKVTLASLLKTMVDQGASDLHITVGVPPEYRISGRMVKVKVDPLTASDTKELCYSVINEHQKVEFEKNLDLDFSFGIKDLARFRGNLFYQRGAVGGVFRQIPIRIPEFDELKLPSVLRKIIRKPNGLILVTGPTGSGKSTTLAAILDLLNREEYGHLITIEDPIEFVHSHKNCIVNQREVGADTLSFHNALRQLLRQDPDFILVGELRDAETIESALTMAETGHLVFGTLHTNSAVQTINRIVNAFPPHQQAQIRQLLSFTLQCVVSQILLPKSYEAGRVMACEVMIPTIAIRNLIREDKIHQLYSAMLTGQEESGMQTLNQCLVALVRQGVLNKKDALDNAVMPDELAKLLQNVPDKK